MWSGCNASQAAAISGVPESTIATLVAQGLIESQDNLSFSDLRLLKQLAERLSRGLSMEAAQQEILRPVHPSQKKRTKPELTAQQELPFAEPTQIMAEGSAPVISLEDRRQTTPNQDSLDAQEFFEYAIDLEDTDPMAAAQAYRDVLRLEPTCVDAWINLGRIYAEESETVPAMECFQKAYELDPADSTAVYNLAVVAQDSGHDDEAISLYRHALALDPQLAEAHYNLATIFDKSGDERAAIRHINEYRKLVKLR